MSRSLRSFAWQGEAAAVALLLDAFQERPQPMLEVAPGRFELAVELPDDASIGYGFLVDAAGAEPSAGWPLHRVEPGADAAAVIPHPWGAAGVLAVSEGATARIHPAWRADAPPAEPATARALRTASDRALLRLGDGAAETLVVVFDGAIWSDERFGFRRAFARWKRPGVHVALVGTADRAVLDRRAAMRTILEEVLDAAGSAAARVIVAGQSYGGLAAGGLLLDAPDLVDAAVLQSGSFWFDEAADAGARDFDVSGTLVQQLRTGTFSGGGRRAVVQVGDDEGDMIERSRDFADAATAAGFVAQLQVWPGGHDYAWYRHGLLTGLDLLLG